MFCLSLIQLWPKTLTNHHEIGYEGTSFKGQAIYWYAVMHGLNSLIRKVKLLLLLFVSVQRLLEKGVSPDSTNEDGLTALHQVTMSPDPVQELSTVS